MIRRHAALFRLTLVVADAALALFVLVVATRLRFGTTVDWTSPFLRAVPYPGLTVAVFVSTWIGLLWLHGLYRGRAHWTVQTDATEVVRATVVLVAISLSLLFLLKLPDVSRLLLVVVFPSMAIAALGVRVVVRLVLGALRSSGRNVRFMLVLGTSARAKAFADLIEGHTELGLVVVGHLRADAEDDGVDLGRPILGSMESLQSVLHSQIIDEVAICLPFTMEAVIERVARLCEQEGKVVRIPAAPIERVLTLGQLENIDGLGVYSLVNGPDRAVGLMVKRILDTVGSAFLLILLSPVFALVALAVKFDSGGSVLFRQERIGLHGRTFFLVKFRTMCSDAEELLENLRERNEVEGHAFKMDDDPRVTRIGRFLRRTSLDELPQLWNVLRGEMSLVGPRPPLPDEVAEYDIWHRRRLSMKPGMTGLWQVAARKERMFDQWVEKDLEYIDSWSLWLDVKIILLTVPAVLAGSGR